MGGRRVKRAVIAVVVGVAMAVVTWSLVADGKPPLAVVTGVAAALVTAFLPGLVDAARGRNGAIEPPAVVGPPPKAPQVVGLLPREAAHFQPRTVEMTRLRAAVAGPGRVALVALPGARGAGKTQLAAAYARECISAGFDLVAWLNAESGPVSGLADVARARGLGPTDSAPEVLAGAALRWLEADEQAWRLVVLDNVDDPDELRNWLPSRGGAKVLVTTNRAEFTQMDGVNAVEVGMFTELEGRRFLHEMTGLPDGEDARAVGAELGWLPLGLAQAGAYIARGRHSYRQYLELLERQPLDETMRQRAGAQHAGVLAATALSMAVVAEADWSGDAVRLLSVLSVLSPDGVSRRLLEQGATGLGLAGGVLPALNVLSGWSLVVLSGPVDAQDRVLVAVHRLTARIVRLYGEQPRAVVPTAAAADAAVKTVEVLSAGLPLMQVALRRADVEELAGHVKAVRAGIPVEPSEQLLAQVDWAGRALVTAGDLSHATSLLETNLVDRVRVLGSEHPDTLISRSNLAFAYRLAGRAGEAITLDEQVLSVRVRVLGNEHPNTLLSRNNLAAAYQSAGRIGEAITLYEQTLADRVRVLGSEHPNTLTSRNNLASAYQSAGRIGEAITLIDHTLVDQVRVLGNEHPDTMTSRNNLAYAYQSAGRIGEAISLYEQTLADRVRLLGSDHPSTLASCNNLAAAYLAAGRVGEAIALHERTLADCVRVLGGDHPDTLASSNNLAYAYQSAGQVRKAIPLYEQTLADRVRVLGSDHPSTLISRNNLAHAYRAAGRKKEATRLLRGSKPE
ncbi:tetratricopeptide repeat protein [Catellatospora sp. NPDC049133]|uniref:tetratricopeptide repeat protein n=1 Tax=Catellatospora sp. NPDC049133 TaxID=3155499 RepID=UPI0033D3F798